MTATATSMYLCPNCQQQWSRKPLTAQQRKVYDFLCFFRASRGHAPSYREIADHFQWQSLSTANEHLTKLEAKGWIRRTFHESRAIRLVEPLG